MDPYRILRALRRGRWWLLGAALLGALLGYVVGKFVMPRTYESRTALVYEGSDTDLRNLRTLVDSVKLPTNLRKVRERLSLSGTLEEIGARIQVEHEFDSNMLSFATTADTPEGAKVLAETAVEVFLEHRREVEGERRQEVLADAERNVTVAQENVTSARTRYDAFRRENGIMDLSVDRQAAIAQAAELQAAADLARADASALEAGIRSLRGQVASDEPTLVRREAPAEVRAELRRLQAELTEAQASLTDEHPRVRALRARVAMLEQRVAEGSGVEEVRGNPRAALLTKTLGEQALEREATTEREAALRSMAREAAERVERLTAVEGEASNLLAAVRVAEAHLQEQRALVAQAQDDAREVQTGFRVASPAVLPVYPLKDSARYAVAAGTPLALLLITFLVFVFREVGRLRPHTATEVAFWGNAPVVGASTWPRNTRALSDLVDEMDDFLLEASGRTLVVPASDREAELVGPLATRLGEEGWRPTTYIGAAEVALDEVSDPSMIQPGTALVPRQEAAAIVSASAAQVPAPMLDAQPWTGPIAGPSLRRAVRLADRVLVVVGAGSLTGPELAAIKGRLGREDGVGYVVVGIDDDFVHLPDRAGEVSGFWNTYRQ